ncbi:Hypothetical predicted protein, partial [Marmota monax]
AVLTEHELDGCTPDTSLNKVGAYLGQKSAFSRDPYELQKTLGPLQYVPEETPENADECE